MITRGQGSQTQSVVIMYADMTHINEHIDMITRGQGSQTQTGVVMYAHIKMTDNIEMSISHSRMVLITLTRRLMHISWILFI